MGEKKKLLWLSDSPMCVTGYATISTAICNGMVDKGWTVDYMGNNYIGQPVPGMKFMDGKELKFNIYGRGRQDYCQDLITPRCRELKPDVFGILLDTFMMYPWYLNTDTAPAKTLFYFPSDGGGGLPVQCEKILQRVDMPVAMSKFAQKQAWDVHKVKTEYIPHAVDEKVYYPMSKEEKNKARKKWGLIGKYVVGGVGDLFIVGTVARNQGRKMMDRTIKAFARFCKDKPDAVLLLHCDPFDAAATFDIRLLIQRFGIQNRVIFTGTKYYKGFDYYQMNEVYNLMDVFLLSTSGEGFGVPTIEAMSAEIPVLVTDYTTTQELVTDWQSGEAIKCYTDITGSWTVERGIMDIPDCIEKLNKLYADPELRKKYGKNGRKAVLKEYTWEKVNKQWFDLLEKMTE